MSWQEVAFASWVNALQWLFLLYFVGINGGYAILNLLSLAGIKRYMEARTLDSLPRIYSGFEPPVSILVPAYNTGAAIAGSVRALLRLEYPEFEVIVVNDDSSDGTLAALTREFELAPFPEAYWKRLNVKPVRGFYRSAIHSNLRVIDKAHGGKADALNAGINAAHYPLFCAVDTDSILQRDSLQRIVQPFLEDPTTVASGSVLRVANGCTVTDGFLADVRLPGNPLALIQIVEYLRAFLFGRLGWSPFNAALIISGGFAVFRKEAVVEAGGYRDDTVGEDMELIVRLHRLNRVARKAYRITVLPDPICWTEAPGSLQLLRKQRVRWQHGLAEALSLNLKLLFHPRGGTPGWLAFPFMALFEWFGPLLEVLGYLLMAAAFALGLVSAQAFVAFMLVAVGFGIMVSVSALLIEEMSFHLYRKPGELAWLLGAVLMENFGYRQLIAVWRVIGLARWTIGGQAGRRQMAPSAIRQPSQQAHSAKTWGDHSS